MEALVKILKPPPADELSIMNKLQLWRKGDESREVVFDAPDQSKWFTGRENELSILEKCLQLEKSSVLNMAAICGLGGFGKTTLAAHFAWEREPEYEGGVFWISMKDYHRSDLLDPTGQEKLLKELIGELGGLPLALEQAGAHIKALSQCPISKYLEEYKIQRLKLLSQHPAKPSSEYESKSRLAVHTTWLINFEYVKKSTNGEAASRFVNVCAFLEPHEIQDGIIDGKVLSSDDKVLESSCGPLIKDHILEVITKFSLFQRISSTSLGLHRLVQEVIRTRMTIEETASSMLVAEQASASVTDPSLFYHWSKLTIHASELQQHLRCFLDQGDIGKEVKTVVLITETSRIIYENAMKLSVYDHQEKAKEAKRFAFQILDFDVGVSKNLNWLHLMAISSSRTVSFGEMAQPNLWSMSMDQSFLQCTIKGGGGCGLVVHGSNASASMVQCHVTGNGMMGCYASGVRVLNKGRVTIHTCHIHGNTRGIWVDEEQAGVLAKEAIIIDSEIYDNRYEGILVAGLPPHNTVSLPVEIRENKIFHSGTFGVRVMLNHNDVTLENNEIFESFYWRIYIHSNSGGLYKGNKICNNKMGDIMAGVQSPGKIPCVIENNYIHDNCGPTFHEGLFNYELYSFPLNLQKVLMLKDAVNLFAGQHPLEFKTVAPNMVSVEFKPSNRCSGNDHGSTNLTSHKLGRYCAFCLRNDVGLKSCKSCMSAKYCGKECQLKH
ncbi:hypothetical protein AWC38_SpisGene15497 [Stylophora pistillata]|uniref:Uncharacterized protein n=1 Tax=Stylophora pistillata TaxID=50429 RepID=A0A2B4RUS7_STYPI|nr:hypothetical protein AWC38_SpisGene15497 [Stylophora pistillata]